MSEDVAFHEQHPVFSRRPLTTGLIRLVENGTSLNTGEAFVAVNFFFLFLSGIFLFMLAEKRTGYRWALWSIVIYYLSFTIVFAFFQTNYTFDEPLQYTLLFLSLYSLIQHKIVLFLLVFSGSLIARENGFILLPAIFFFLMNGFENQSSVVRGVRKSWLMFLPVGSYVVYLFVYRYFHSVPGEQLNEVSSRMLLLQYNFQDVQYAVESFSSFFQVIGFQVYITYAHFQDKQPEKEEKQWLKAFILSFVINSLVVFFLTKDREMRLFALPLVFLWPFLGKYVYEEFHQLVKCFFLKRFLLDWINLSLSVLWFFLAYQVSFHAYKPTGVLRQDTYMDEYLFAELLIIGFHGLAKNSYRRYRITEK